MTPAPFPQGGGLTNLALNKAAIQSSTYQGAGGAVASLAVDGNTSGNWLDSSVTATNNEAQAWWQVDLGGTFPIQHVDVWNRTDCCGDRLTNFNVVLLDANQSIVSSVNYASQAGAPTSIQITGTARYVKVQLVGTNYLSLAEVQVWGSAVSNLALNKTATQSSTYQSAGGAIASLAVDGNASGNWLDYSVTATNNEPQAWWQVDLGTLQIIQSVEVWNRTDCCGDRLSNFNVILLDSSQSVVANVNVPGQGGTPTLLPISGLARFVKIQLVATNHLSLAEVRVWGTPFGGTASERAMARLDLQNRTGSGGEDLLSNNFNWSLPVVSLPGRSGLDLGLTLSYNSLVWTRAGNYIDFDQDQGSIAPGFRLGFPVVEGPYANSQTGANFYLLITPSGGRIELRQVGTSIVYESKDSTYLELIDNLNSTLTLRPPDGSQMNFIGVDGAWRCNQIKDRNGNFINATYKSWGEFETVTDTLGRVLTFNYDTNLNLISITQTWAGQTHEWATFGWGTASIGNNFPGLNNLGPNSTTIPVLTQVGLPDGSRYNFEYANTFGMVSTIRHYASDNHQRNYTTYVTPASAIDCPRLTERRVWAEAWTGVNGVPAQVVTYFGHDADNGCRMTLPDGTVHKEYYGSSWQSGLPTETRSYATVADANSNLWQKKTTTAWTQDNPSFSYKTNPRVTQTIVSDGANIRKTTIDYSVPAYAQFGLPYFVTEYAADGVTELRRTYRDYNLSQPYLDHRIIGLVSAVHLTDASGYQAKVTYSYDDPNRLGSEANNATMHDQSYHGSFTVRGNVTSVSRWDVTDINNQQKSLTNYLNYNAAGSVVATTDPAGHANQISYADSFSDGNNTRNTFAYPTTVTDADGFSSTIQYNFDFGAKTRIEGPPPQNQTQGIIQTFSYDEAMRLKRVTTVNTGAYVHYDYGPNYTSSFASVNAVAPDYWESDSYTNRFFDGLGRVFAVASNHPNSTGGNKGQYTRYDQMGRAVQQTNPFEMNSGWSPTGDDAAGYQFNVANTFDWQGRPKKTYNMDGTYTEASYAGCGCAGGEVVTLTDEVGRRQKLYSDISGRTRKAEILNWNGSVYSTTTNTFNTSDQVTLVRQWAGPEVSGTYQDTTMAFDGYGRLQSKHVPEQNAGAATVYAYNSDDTIQSVTDARGASASYVYNNSRHLVNEIHYSAPAGITPTSNVTFGYDAAGNRTSMTDGLGVVSYAYNQLSQMTSETRTFNDPQNPAINGVSKTISYGEYNLAGQLKSITDPFNATINYGHDAMGRLSSVAGTSFAGVTSYATGVHYRAWGAVKNLSFENGRTMSASYNSRMQMTGLQGVIYKNYQYFADGNLRYSQDLVDDRFDRSYAYDHTSRVSQALSGPEARGEPPSDNRPYNQSFTYDAFNHLTSQVGQHWSSTSSSSNGSFVNNRRVGSDYDADGNVLSGNSPTYTYNAAGQIAVVQWGSDNTGQGFDGNGLRSKTTETTFTNGQPSTEVRYYVRSTVLGGKVVTELNAGGGKQRSFVYARGQVLAWQRILSGVERVTWEHRDPSNASFRTTNEDGTMNWQTYVGDGAPAELDPTGGNADVLDPYLSEPPPEENQGSLISHGSFGDASQLGTTYSWDGIPMPTDELFQMVNLHSHGRFGILEYLARESQNDKNYQQRWVGPQGDRLRETTALAKSSPWTSAGGFGLLFAEPQKPPPVTEQNATLGEVAKFDPAELDDCGRDLFRTKDDSATFNGPRIGGSFTVKIGRKPVTIAFDTQSKTKADLKIMGRRRDGEVIGLYDARTQTIYIASDVVSDPNEPDVYVTAIKVHEVGNFLRHQTGRHPQAKSRWLRRQDGDAGMALEECVFKGGLVARTGGRISTNR